MAISSGHIQTFPEVRGEFQSTPHPCGFQLIQQRGLGNAACRQCGAGLLMPQTHFVFTDLLVE